MKPGIELITNHRRGYHLFDLFLNRLQVAVIIKNRIFLVLNKNHRHPFTDVFNRVFTHQLGAAAIEGDINNRFAGLWIKTGTGISNVFTGKNRALFQQDTTAIAMVIEPGPRRYPSSQGGFQTITIIDSFKFKGGCRA